MSCALINKSTKELKVRFNKIRQLLLEFETRYGREHIVETINSLKQEQQDIKYELNKRPHVPSKKQSKLIRQMSKKAGKKLSLRDSQLLNNSLSC